MRPPPGPFRAAFWRSPARGRWLTSVLGGVLLFGIPVMFVTGLLDYAAYDPWLGRPNDKTPHKGILGFYLFHWPTDPAWLFRLTQGTHVVLGLALVPILLAKLWSVLPRLFAWPPVRTPLEALERLSLLLLVGGAVFEFGTGICDIQLFYPWPFSFYTAHFYGAWVFTAAFVVHAALKLPRAWRAVRHRDAPADEPDELRSPLPAEPTISRRGLLGFAAAGSLTLVAVSVGQVVGGPLRRWALLAPHGRDYGTGPNAFQVNKSAAVRRISAALTGEAWRLELVGPAVMTLTRQQLLELPLATHELPIACVEGWSTSQRWTGVPLRDLARLAGVPDPSSLYVESLQRGGAFGTVNLAANQVLDPRSLLALRVNGTDLSLDHGYPARIVVPAAPGVHCTKWVRRLAFRAT